MVGALSAGGTRNDATHQEGVTLLFEFVLGIDEQHAPALAPAQDEVGCARVSPQPHDRVACEDRAAGGPSLGVHAVGRDP